jgi:cardiolipin synthase
MLTLPNFLTLLRIIAVPAFLILLANQQNGAALVLFVLASITDTADGVIARMTDARSDLGATLDPLADKLLIVSAFVSLMWMEVIPVWLFILVVLRDVIVVGGYLAIYFFTTPMEVNPSGIGKLNAFMQMSTIGFALVTVARPDIHMDPINFVTQYGTGVTTALSGVHYVYSGLLWYQRQEVGGDGTPT